MANKSLLILLTISYLLNSVSGNVSRPRTPKRIHLPFLGLGPRCSGCPQHFCDDDPAIVHGYCCGCAKFYDTLPVQCSPQLKCPLNNYDLCEDYEYMIHCCCS